jgi:hypothetical protein
MGISKMCNSLFKEQLKSDFAFLVTILAAEEALFAIEDIKTFNHCFPLDTVLKI